VDRVECTHLCGSRFHYPHLFGAGSGVDDAIQGLSFIAFSFIVIAFIVIAFVIAFIIIAFVIAFVIAFIERRKTTSLIHLGSFGARRGIFQRTVELR